MKLRLPFYYGWVVAAACFLTIMTWGEAFWSYGLFVKPLQAEFGWSRAAISLALSVNLLLLGVASPISGWLIDRHGARRVILGSLALLSKNEVVSAIINGVFVAEALSVMLQVLSFKSRGKRIFLMAPIHHHFELKGWAEPKVIVRFWIISIMLAIASLSTLKLR